MRTKQPPHLSETLPEDAVRPYRGAFVGVVGLAVVEDEPDVVGELLRRDVRAGLQLLPDRAEVHRTLHQLTNTGDRQGWRDIQARIRERPRRHTKRKQQLMA